MKPVDHELSDAELRSLWAKRSSARRLTHSGGRKPIATACKRCRELQPSARQARSHCVKKKV